MHAITVSECSMGLGTLLWGGGGGNKLVKLVPGVHQVRPRPNMLKKEHIMLVAYQGKRP